MQIFVQKVEFKKVVSEPREVNIPISTLYLWFNGERRAYSVAPVWTTWNKEHYAKEETIYEYNVVVVDPSLYSIQSFTISVSNISDILQDVKHPFHRLIETLIDEKEIENTSRTKEQFMADFKNTLKQIKERL
jgi:hypothetical protein